MGRSSPSHRVEYRPSIVLRTSKLIACSTDCPIAVDSAITILPLTSADYVFLLDPWWNPAVEAQAIDRAHRMGQQNPVIAYRMICRDTVEEKIVSLQQSKRDLADKIVRSDESLIRSLTADDLQILFD